MKVVLHVDDIADLHIAATVAHDFIRDGHQSCGYLLNPYGKASAYKTKAGITHIYLEGDDRTATSWATPTGETK